MGSPSGSDEAVAKKRLGNCEAEPQVGGRLIAFC